MKIQSPWMGRIKGSAGNMTGCKVYDKNVMRAKAFEVSNPKTHAQVTQRNFFAELTATVSNFTEEQLRFLFPAKPKAMSRRNALSKQIGENSKVAAGVKSIDFASIESIGNAPKMDFGVTQLSNADGSTLVTLDQSVVNNTSVNEYQFAVVLVNVTKKEMVLPEHTVAVSDGTWSYATPTTWNAGDTMHAIPLITDSKLPSVGFGTMGVTKRPAR